MSGKKRSSPRALGASERPEPRKGFGGFFRKEPETERPPLRHWQTTFWPEERHIERAFIVHGRCADGFTSAGLLLHRWPKSMVLYAQPAELLERLEHAARNPPREALVIADVGPQRDQTKAVVALLGSIRRTCKVTWIDHHAPQWTDDLEKALRQANVELVVDKDKKESGASLVATWATIRNPSLLRVADLVRRRDAWTDPANPAARAWVAIAGARRREYVDLLADVELEGLEEEGLRLVQEKDVRVAHVIERRLKRHSREVYWQWSGDDVSDVAEQVFQKEKEALVYLQFGPRGNVSIRTRDNVPIAADLAQRFGGGGHANAAGLHFKLTGTRALFYALLRGRHPKARAVRKEAQDIADAYVGDSSRLPRDES